MSEYSIYIDREDYHKVEEEEQNRFVRSILSEIGIPFEEIWPDISLTVNQKVKLRKLLDDFDIDIINEGQGLKIYVGKELIASWEKPRYIIRKDPSALKQSKKTYFEVKFNYWSMFEDIEDEETGE